MGFVNYYSSKDTFILLYLVHKMFLGEDIVFIFSRS